MSGTTCALQHRDFIGQVQSGRSGFGLGVGWKAWGKGTILERRPMVTTFVRKQEEETRAMDELACFSESGFIGQVSLHKQGI